MSSNHFSKLPNRAESIFATMTKMANDYSAINLSQGFPDFNCSEELLERVAFYQSKRDLITKLLSKSRFKFTPTQGTYFQLLDYSSISDMNDMEFAKYLTREIGVAVIPLSPFYLEGSRDKVIRICFAKNDEVLHNAADRLCYV
jgi:aspartate/methionine/tyrosine aminotransferase